MRIPDHRRAEIIIEPLYPRLGLLGGASNTGKLSKLAALAAKRRQKESDRGSVETTTNAETQEHYLSSLEKLRISQTAKNKPEPTAAKDFQPTERPASENSQIAPERVVREPEKPALGDTTDAALEVDQNLRGQPSAFASIMTNHDTENSLSASREVFCAGANAKSFNFAEPSPDDIVTKAQTATGRL